MPAGRLMLLDTPSLYYRAFFGVPESMKAPDGTPVNAVRGLLDMIARLVDEHRPERLVCCFDADWRPQFRVAAIPSYKAHRVAAQTPEGSVEETPDTLTPQLPVIDAVLDALGLPRAELPGYEADDVIGTLAARDPGPVDVVTGDRDLFQLVDASRDVRILYTAKGIRNLGVFGEDEIAARYGIPGRAYADFAILRGDPSDGLPGVPGIGEKTAAALVSRFGSLAGVLEALDAGVVEGFPAGSRRKLEAGRAYLGPAELVCRVVTDLPVEVDDTLPSEPRDPAELESLAARWNLASPLKRLISAL
ncbi:5'-3' exonuclease [Actinocorallia aurantiaca]|uniref:5'-3' exonuclease n=1 Tax=Actinocorallia aurantiaca TaxID=46204 RepID=A0ABN3UDY1_9ACTN